MMAEAKPLELEDWVELEVACEMRPADVYGGEGCQEPAVWRLVRWCGCSELSCESCRASYLAWLAPTLAAAPGQLVTCARKCLASTRATMVVDVVRRVVAL